MSALKISEIPDGGPAFPVPLQHDDVGMTLRQWYAGMAMQAELISSAIADPITTYDPGSLSEQAFIIADAMIAHEAAERRDG